MSQDNSPAGGANPADISEVRVNVSRTVAPDTVLPQPKTGPGTSVEAVEALKLDDKTSADPAEATPAESDAENTDQGDEAQDEQSKPKKRNRNTAQERISELTARLRAAESAARSAERRLRELNKPVQQNGKAPEELSFDEAEALRLRKAIRAERAAEVEHERDLQQNQAVAHRNAVFAAKVESVAERMPDLWQRFDQVPVTETAAEFIVESEKTVELAHYLASNPREADRIARIGKVDPRREAIELARIEGRLEKAPTTRKVSAAPPPHTKIAGAAVNTATKSPDQMSYEEYKTYMEARGL